LREGPNRALLALGSALCAVALTVPATAGAATPDYLAGDTIFSGTTIALRDGSNPGILSRVVLTGKIQIPGMNETVTVAVRREGRLIASRRVPTNPETGRYRLPLKLTGCCDYIAQARHGTEISSALPFSVHAPKTLEPGRLTLLFNRLLQGAGYHMGDVSDQVDEGTELAILAMRKTNEMERTEEYEPALFNMLLRGEGRFEPVHDEDDRHVEVDLSRQVMALVEDGRATDVFHVSSGAFGTPTGTFSFYSKAPGYNQKGMYYSVYYDGNYATHGYYTVPTYPASHGCVRNPEVYSVFIYDWISLGDPIFIYE
jgi:hypothetical protein